MRINPVLIVVLLCSLAPGAGLAQDGGGDEKGGKAATPDKPVSEIDRLVEQGAVSLLEGKLRNGTPEELFKLAQAARNGAKREKNAEKRDKGFTDAEKRYQKLIELLEKSSAIPEAARRDVERTRAHAELAGMILSSWAAAELDRNELSDGRLGDRKGLLEKLSRALDHYGKANKTITPMYEARDAREDEFLSQGVMDDIRRLKLDSDFNLGFTHLYLGQASDKESPQRTENFAAAQKRFQALIDTNRTGPEMFQVHMGLGIALREQKKLDEALRQFRLAMEDGADVTVVMQTRYELARVLLLQEKFDEARTLLDPLRTKDPNALTPDERGGRFYVNLAKLWDANSYLLEAESLRRASENSPARAAILARSRAARETGLSRMNKLSSSGGAWPAVVKLYVTDLVKTDSDLSNLSVLELKLAAGKKTDLKDHAGALKLLQEAAKRAGTEPELAGDVQFDLAKCHYDLNDLRSAATAFSELASKYKSHSKAEQAATFSYKCWASVAEESKSRDDYAKLAATLNGLLAAFPKHPDRNEALWWLPVALQAAGQYEEAGKRFADVPRESLRWEEAQFRRAVCTRHAAEAKRVSLAGEEFVLEARKAARIVREYASEALARVPKLTEKEKVEVMGRSGEALVNAAELLSSPGVERFADSLECLADFEQKYGASDLLGRVLAARIRAYRGQKQFDDASKVLERYLQTVTPDKASAVLAGLARSMQDEIDHMQADGRTDDARKMATDAVAIFEQLLKSVAADEKRAADTEVVKYGLGRMLLLAGDVSRAGQIAAELIAKNAKNGNFQRLSASVLTAQLSDASSKEAIGTAKAAWEELLKDGSLRKRVPLMYWEARWNWLDLHMRAGAAAEVEKAIRQERVWYPDLGGEPWKSRLEDLYLRAATAAGVTPVTATQPASQAASEPAPE